MRIEIETLPGDMPDENVARVHAIEVAKEAGWSGFRLEWKPLETYTRNLGVAWKDFHVYELTEVK